MDGHKTEKAGIWQELECCMLNDMVQEDGCGQQTGPHDRKNALIFVRVRIGNKVRIKHRMSWLLETQAKEPT